MSDMQDPAIVPSW